MICEPASPRTPMELPQNAGRAGLLASERGLGCSGMRQSKQLS